MLQPKPHDAPLEKSGQPQGKNRDDQRGTQIDDKIVQLIGQNRKFHQASASILLASFMSSEERPPAS